MIYDPNQTFITVKRCKQSCEEAFVSGIGIGVCLVALVALIIWLAT